MFDVAHFQNLRMDLGGWIGVPFERYETTDSTMDEAFAALSAGAPAGHLVLAETQRAGRGAHGRSWVAAPGENLTFSFLAPASPWTTLAVGVGIARSIDALFGEAGGEASGAASRTRIKWPNDVLLGDGKVAGILVESRSSGSRPPKLVVVGVGLNVHQRTFPQQEQDSLPATSLATTGLSCAREEVLARTTRHIERALELPPAQLVDAVNAQLAWREEPVRLDEHEGVLVGVQPSGAIRIRRPDGSHSDHIAGRLRRR